jgi:hypothetical protein
LQSLVNTVSALARTPASEIAEDLRDALEQIESVLADLKTRVR